MTNLRTRINTAFSFNHHKYAYISRSFNFFMQPGIQVNRFFKVQTLSATIHHLREFGSLVSDLRYQHACRSIYIELNDELSILNYSWTLAGQFTGCPCIDIDFQTIRSRCPVRVHCSEDENSNTTIDCLRWH